MSTALLADRLLDPAGIRELVRGANLGEAEPAPEPELERGPDDVRVRGELLAPEPPPPPGEALGDGLLRGAARGLLGAGLDGGLDDRDLTLGARWTGADEDGLELFSIRERPELGAGRKMSELPLDDEPADGTREEVRPTGSLPRLTRELDSPEEPDERDVAVDRVSRPPNRLQPSLPLVELEPGDRTEDGELSPRLPERTEGLPEAPFAPPVSNSAAVPGRRL